MTRGVHTTSANRCGHTDRLHHAKRMCRQCYWASRWQSYSQEDKREIAEARRCKTRLRVGR